ncbi:hypothetical protein HJ202_19015 [Vibrio parahaemolyticus]|uniref:hypothetical protein n=1 Tax=Vibrio TaxID=662 RepID=UPI000472E292|nr:MULTISPECIES: hypothetical protein [Vibrio]MDW1727164.1 hypothetical protein [Vibrio sp. Vb2909]MDW2126591.1 hypothetical protein [Vibrio sp. 2033]MDW2298035.1 hypothetical protein [Vibrio sp. 1404]OOH98261.1 hypothetical protein BIW16_19355 [Vibrio sp. OULL4]ARR10307.1 hypothetical protein Vc3S01_p20192 [Vibrio campbellii]
MRYLLVTVHNYPRFYKSDGEIVHIDLNYVDSKTISSLDENGDLFHVKVSGSPPCVRDIWLIDSVDVALDTLASYGIYPFKNKAAARANAKRLGLSAFKYIAVP